MLALRHPGLTEQLWDESFRKARIWGRLHGKSDLEIEVRQKEMLALLLVHHFEPKFHTQFIDQVRKDVPFTLYTWATP
jgi:hypothetical protein